MVSTIPESLFRQHFEPWGQERLKSCHWLQLRAANGLAIPYIGYLELDVELCGRRLPGCGILVVKDPPGCLSAQVPGVLGMNVIRKCYKELFGHHGLALFDLPVVSEAPKPVMQALQKCHQASVKPDQSAGKVKVRGKSACRIPGGVMKIVVATCSEQYSGSTVLFEPLDSGLPAGLLASPALVPVVRGTAYIPIVNRLVWVLLLAAHCCWHAAGRTLLTAVCSLFTAGCVLLDVRCGSSSGRRALRSAPCRSGSPDRSENTTSLKLQINILTIYPCPVSEGPKRSHLGGVW
ncbi:hypothetical protein N1851_005015 [Merluccius polli]|uniref:Uncharacterized protein n=1 Tax=Merluccius polli TaxID=89951 RepID=A0AA47N6H7_MERPO|nr:hypothetical protein N1851_005015 [Merluccius polli]